MKKWFVNASKPWFPHPIFSLMVAAIWLLMAGALTPGQILLALVTGWGLPFFSAALWPVHTPMKKPLVLARFLLTVLVDIVFANLVVAGLILGPQKRLKPGFVIYPLALQDRLAISILANTISLTPGTVSADVSLQRNALLIHGLNIQDQQELIDSIRRRYEQPLKEVFE